MERFETWLIIGALCVFGFVLVSQNLSSPQQSTHDSYAQGCLDDYGDSSRELQTCLDLRPVISPF